MYTIYNPNLMWAQQQLPMQTGQVYVTPVPSMPTTYVVNGMPPTAIPVGQGQAVYYHPQAPNWLPVSKGSYSDSDDDVFISDSQQSTESGIADVDYTVQKKKTKVVECQTEESCFRRHNNITPSKPKRKLANRSLPDSSGHGSEPSSDNSLSNSGSSFKTNSPRRHQELEVSNLDATRPPFVPSSWLSGKQARFSSDITLGDIFSASLCSAINEDPPDPRLAHGDISPLKTSSPILEDEDDSQCPPMVDMDKLKTVHHRFVANVSSERSLKFNENGWDIDVDNVMGIKGTAITTRRDEFLKILDYEREKQKRLVLPKHAPKMNCKFCKNNGEPPEVYTKHRLHFDEKTVCPLLRHYVCRLCNSTGDFAHTIRHCPFNSRYDKLAWKATFL